MLVLIEMRLNYGLLQLSISLTWNIHSLAIFSVPKVRLKDNKAFNLLIHTNKAQENRGVDGPLRSLNKAGNDQLYTYRYDWDDHRRFIITDFRELIGAAHATNFIIDRK